PRATRTAASPIRRARTGRARAASGAPSRPHPFDRLRKLGELALETAADVLAEREDAFVDDAVVDVVSVLAPADDAGLGEHAKVLRDVLLRAPERLSQFIDARLALAQPVEQPDPHRLADHAEARGDQLDELIRQRVGKDHWLSLIAVQLSRRTVAER